VSLSSDHRHRDATDPDADDERPVEKVRRDEGPAEKVRRDEGPVEKVRRDEGPAEKAERERAERQRAAYERADRAERAERRRGIVVVALVVGAIALIALIASIIRDDEEVGRSDAQPPAAEVSRDVPEVMPVVDLLPSVRDLAFADSAAPAGAAPPPAESTAGVRVVLDADVLFPKDSPALRPSAHERLREVADAFAARGPGSLRIVGYTDDLGSAQHGLVLSQQRAAAVSAVLRPLLPAAGYTISALGRGEASPAVPNTSESNRRRNRRVEITYVRR
jgi:outer membrane protein OmpA-like peptidoglycan-associated protein